MTKNTTRKAISELRKTAIPVALTSDASYPGCGVETLTGSFGLCVGMIGLQYLRQVRIVDRDQRPLLQLRKVPRHPKGDHRDRDGGIFKDPEAEVQVAPGIG